MADLSPHIRGRLDVALKTRLAQVIAPAGYGKSSIVDYLARQRSARVARLRAGDEPPLALMRALCEAISAIAPELRTLLPTAYLNASAQGDLNGLAGWFSVNLVGRSDLIALDDLQVLGDDSRAWDLLEKIVESEEAAGCSWIFLSRVPLSLPTVQWVASGDLGPTVTVEDLTFGTDEILGVGADVGVMLKEYDAEDILRVSRGWPLLCTYMVRVRYADPIAAERVTEAGTQAGDVLGDLLVRRLGADQKPLLLVTALFDSVAFRDLEEYGYRDASRLLHELVALGVPLVRGADGRYRLHDLVGEYLRTTERSALTAEARHLIERLLEHEYLEAALRVAVVARDAELVARVLRDEPRFFGERADATLVDRALAQLPTRVLERDARLLFVQACRVEVRTNETVASRYAGLAVELADAAFRPTALEHLWVYRRNHDAGPDALREVADALRREPLPENAEEACEVLSALATAASFDHCDDADRTMQRAFALASGVSDTWVRARVYQRGAYLRWLRGDLSGAEELSLRALEMAQNQVGFSLVAVRCYQLLSAVYYDRPAEALVYIDRWRLLSEKMLDRTQSHRSQIAKFSCLVRLGDTEQARQLAGSIFPLRTLISDDRRVAERSLAILQLLNNEYEKGLQTTREVSDARDNRHSHWKRAFQAKDAGIRALAAQLASEYEEGINSARKVYRWAAEVCGNDWHRDGLTSDALELGILCAGVVHYAHGNLSAKSLLVEIARDSTLPARRACAAWLVQLFEGVDSEPDPVVSSLAGFVELFRRVAAQRPRESSEVTPAERRVLDRLADGGTTKELAVALGRSPKTIENQISSIMRKLGARSRTEAVMVAQRRGLVSQAPPRESVANSPL